MKLNLGAGSDIRDGCVNHDIAELSGIDVVHDLNIYPWPWSDSTFDKIVANDLLEHLDDFMLAMEEMYRILKPGGEVEVKVPYWNSTTCHADPTHKRGFHELRFHFFDPRSPLCQERHYYTHARFYVENEAFILAPFFPYLPIPGLRLIRVHRKLSRRMVGLIGNMISNIILDLEVKLVKPPIKEHA